MKKHIIILTGALGLSAIIVIAQHAGSGGPGQGRRFGGGPGGQRPMPAFINALDANKDGKLDAKEIANASAALKALDKNGDGELTFEELMGPRPGGDRPGGNRRGGPEGAPGEPPPPPQQ